MFALIARYLAPADEVDRHLDAHRDWIIGNFAAGRFLLTARQVPLVGGLILARGGDIDEMRALVADDPFVRTGVAEYEILEFAPARLADGLTESLAAELPPR